MDLSTDEKVAKVEEVDCWTPPHADHLVPHCQQYLTNKGLDFSGEDSVGRGMHCPNILMSIMSIQCTELQAVVYFRATRNGPKHLARVEPHWIRNQVCQLVGLVLCGLHACLPHQDC